MDLTFLFYFCLYANKNVCLSVFFFFNVYPPQMPRDTQVPELQSKKRSLFLYVEKITINLKVEWNKI